jgi:hypothetical protein
MFEISFAPSINQEARPVLDLLFYGCGFWKFIELKGGTAQGNVALVVAPESPFNGRGNGHGPVIFLVASKYENANRGASTIFTPEKDELLH